MPELTEEELLAQLGMQLEEQLAGMSMEGELPLHIAQAWVAEEQVRSRERWHAPRAHAGQELLYLSVYVYVSPKV